MTMSPSSRDPNANRASRLKIKKESHPIQKPSSSSTSSTSSSTTTARNQPIIIYTSSPKVIHTEPHDFMALVQKLTGLSHANNNPEDIINDDDDNNNNNSSSLQQKDISPMLLPPCDLSFEDSGNNKYNTIVNGDGQLTCSSISSNSLSPNSEAVSPPNVPMGGTTATMGFDQTGLLESSCLLYPDLTEMISPGWAHPSFGCGDHHDLF